MSNKEKEMCPMETMTSPEVFASEIRTLVAAIHNKEDACLRKCLYCSQVSFLLKEVAPLLRLLGEKDYPSYLAECRLLASGVLSFIDSFVYTVTNRFDLGDYHRWGDLVLSDLQNDLLDAHSLLGELSALGLSGQDRSVIEAHAETLRRMVGEVEAARNGVKRIKRRNRIREYLDGPGKALLILLGFIALYVLVKRYA